MPIYEYKCLSCEQLTEVMQRMSDAPLTTCESCGGDLKKQISAPAFQFKGSGWYVTDYADKGKGKGGESKKGADEGDDSVSKAVPKDSGSKDSDSKDSGSKDSGSKDSGSKDSGSKGSGSKDSGAKSSSSSSDKGSD